MGPPQSTLWHKCSSERFQPAVLKTPTVEEQPPQEFPVTTVNHQMGILQIFVTPFDHEEFSDIVRTSDPHHGEELISISSAECACYGEGSKQYLRLLMESYFITKWWKIPSKKRLLLFLLFWQVISKSLANRDISLTSVNSLLDCWKKSKGKSSVWKWWLVVADLNEWHLRIPLPNSEIPPLYLQIQVVFALNTQTLSSGDSYKVQMFICCRILFLYYSKNVCTKLLKIFLKMWGQILNV